MIPKQIGSDALKMFLCLQNVNGWSGTAVLLYLVITLTLLAHCLLSKVTELL